MKSSLLIPAACLALSACSLPKIAFKSNDLEGATPDQVALVTAGNTSFLSLRKITQGDNVIFPVPEDQSPPSFIWYTLLKPGSYTFTFYCSDVNNIYYKIKENIKTMRLEAGKTYHPRCNDKFLLDFDYSTWDKVTPGYYESLKVPGRFFPIPKR